jgi:hypothetical protein
LKSELPIFTDVTLNVQEITALISCLQVTSADNAKIIENEFDVKLEGIKTRLAEAIKGSIDFYEQHIKLLED